MPRALWPCVLALALTACFESNPQPSPVGFDALPGGADTQG